MDIHVLSKKGIRTLQAFASDQRSGTLEATVMRSPTCTGPQKQGEICEAPDSNGTYLIIKTFDYKTIRSINTDNGKFSLSLSPGIYMLQNTEIMIGRYMASQTLKYLWENDNSTI